MAAMTALGSWAQGWPANCKDVMLQGFYWDSYADTKWTTLESQADNLSGTFSLVWVPQSGWCNGTYQMGYADIWWFDHHSAFGSQAELKSMISTFKSKGIGTIEDVVINHKSGNSNWCDFPTETWSGHGTLNWSLADICANDDGGDTKKNGYNVTGANDTGDDFGGSRDLDHTSANVQANIKLYLQFLKKELGYVGFRYDMVKGYAPEYTGIYNASATPTYSVGEYWDTDVSKLTNWIDRTQANGGGGSAAFDFPLKYKINDAFGNGRWTALAEDYLTARDAYKRYAVTFVDNHDTGRSGESPLNANVEAANAFILTMPGTPCVFLRHWQLFETAIKRLAAARRVVGINNMSTIEQRYAQSNGFVLKVRGTEGEALLLLGSPTGVNTTGFQVACAGENYRLYVSNGLDITPITSIASATETFIPSNKCVVNSGEICAFFERPADWGTSSIKAWAWDDGGNYTGGTWPGASCKAVGKAANGNMIYKWTWNGSYTGTVKGAPSHIIFTRNVGGKVTEQTVNFSFKTGNYYTFKHGLIGNVVDYATAINRVVTPSTVTADTGWFTLQGIKINKPMQGGIYIHNGKKVVLHK